MARLLILTVIGVFGASVAHADIGSVGNPNLPQAKTEAPAAAAPVAESKPAPEKPLIEITFDKNHVNYSGTLGQGVAAAEKAKPGVVYKVVSYLPAASGSDRQNARMNERAEENLRAVVNSLKQKGVPTSRINVSTQSGTGGADSVKIFVQ